MSKIQTINEMINKQHQESKKQPDIRELIDLHATAIARQFEKELVNIKRQFRRDAEELMQNSYMQTIDKLEKTLCKMQQKLASYQEHITNMNKISERVEDTLCNVLLAIRQNEYLQAWYPAQGGYSEMKVVGKHPLQGDK